ncbi:MAG: hypothetical protein ACK5NN_11950 [Sphingomonadaceae bacterium]
MDIKSTYLKPALIIFTTLGLSGPVAAYCPEPMSFTSQSLASQVSAQLEWLLCLHNEQVGSLNRHADKINDIADNLSNLAVLLRAEAGRIDGIVIREREDFQLTTAMNARLEDLEQRLRALEAEK